MTLTLHDLAEFKRKEKDEPGMVQPPPNAKAFLADLKAYMQKVQVEAGPHPAQWDMDCEALAAMDLLQDIFRIRRAKLVRACETCTPPTPRQMFDFESNAWFGFLRVYKMLDRSIENVITKSDPGAWKE